MGGSVIGAKSRLRPVRVAIASFSGMPAEFTDDQRIVEALAARGVEAAVLAWDDPDADWSVPRRVVIRSTWNYARRRDEFVRWCDSVGDRLHNRAALVRWNTDKRYLGELARRPACRRSRPTYVAPAEPLPELDGEVVVKPNVSAGWPRLRVASGPRRTTSAAS